MTAFTWNIPASADYTIGASNPADDILTALNSHVTANSGGANAVWQVANYQSTTPKYLLLKRISGAAGRIIVFGQQGQTANSAATRGTPAASRIYIGYSKTSTSNTADANWTSGAPLSASDYMPAISFWPTTTSITLHLTYAEASCGMWFLGSNTSNGFVASGAGELIQDPSAADVSCISGNGTNYCTGFGGTSSSTAGIINATAVTDTYTDTQSGLLVRLSGTNYHVGRATVLGANTYTLSDPGSLKAWFFPIPVLCSTTYPALGVIGKFKQVAMGPSAVRDTTWLDSTTGLVDAFGHAYQTSGGVSAFWLTNFAI
jgi:hypothetical protein